jgi:hypothetical protein
MTTGHCIICSLCHEVIHEIQNEIMRLFYSRNLAGADGTFYATGAGRITTGE